MSDNGHNPSRSHRVARLLDAIPAPERTSTWNSYCLYCAHWHFGEYLALCERCHEPIFRWMKSSELSLLASRSSLHGF